MNAPDSLPRRRLSSTYVHAPPSTQPPPPHSHSYAFNHHDFGPAAAAGGAGGHVPHSYKHSPNNRTFTASSMTAPARTSMSSRRAHWRRPSAPPPPSPRTHIDVEMAPNVAVPILVARAANNAPPSTPSASHNHHHHHSTASAPPTHLDSHLDHDDDQDNEHDNENESTTTTTTTSVTTSTTSRGKQPNGHHHHNQHHQHHAHPSSAAHDDMTSTPTMRRKSLPRTSAASHQSNPNNNNDSFHSSHDNHKLYARLQEWPSLNQPRVRGAYNDAHCRPSNRSKPRASHQEYRGGNDVEPGFADPTFAAHSTAAGGRGSNSSASSSGVPGRSGMKPAVPSCRPPPLHTGGYSNGSGASNNHNNKTATRGKMREPKHGHHQSPSGRLMMTHDPARSRTHSRKPPPSTIPPGAAAAAAATHTSATSSSTAAASAPPLASHSTDKRRKRDWLRLRAALSSMRRAIRRTEGGDASGGAPASGTQGYGSSPHVGMGIRDHDHAHEEDEKIDDEYGDVVDLDIDDEDEEDEEDAEQEHDPLGEYCQRIDRLAADDRFMHYLTAPMSNSEYSDAADGYERRNGGLPRAKTRARIAATLRLSGKVGAGLDGNSSSTANTGHGPGHGKQDGYGRHNGERSGRHDHDRTQGGGLHSWRGSTRSFSPQEHSHADEGPQSQHETQQQEDRDGEQHAQTDAATDAHTTGTSAASTSTTTTSSTAAAAGNGGAPRRLRKSKSRTPGGKGGAKAGTPLATTPQPASQLAVNKLYPLAFIRLLEAHAKHAADKRESSPPVYGTGAAHARHHDLHAHNSSSNNNEHECADVVFDDGDLRDLDADLAPRTASWGLFRWRSDAAHHNQYYHNNQYTAAHNGGNTPAHVMHGSMQMNMNIPVPVPPIPRRGQIHGSGHGRHSHSNAKAHGSGPAFGFGAKARGGGGARSGRASAEITRLIGARRYRSMALHPQYSGDYIQPPGFGHHSANPHAHPQQYYAQQQQQPQLEQQQQQQHDSFQQFQQHKHKNSNRAPRLRDRAFRQHQVPAPSASTMSAMFRSSSAGPPHGHGHGHGSSLDHSRFVPVC